MLQQMLSDAKTVMDRDPAVKNLLEAVLCSPGLHAVSMHRIAQWFLDRKMALIARLVSQFNRFMTGIEIHPGARIGRAFFIDHGAGVVIGETAEIGDNVTIYQGVTLGGTGKERSKRHPTIGNNVVIGAGAKVLGSISIGDDVRIGAGSVVVNPVEAGCTVVGVPARVVRRNGRKLQTTILEHGDLPDPICDVLKTLVDRVEALEERIAELTQVVPRRIKELT